METPEYIACPDCGLLQDLPKPRRGHLVECRRCARVLAGVATGRIDVPLAFALTALLFFIPGALFPLLDVSSFGARRIGWLYSGITTYTQQGFWPLGLLVAAFALVLPLLFLGCLAWVLANLHLGRAASLYPVSLGRVFRWVKVVRPWMMLEVYLVGGFVAYSRINAVASIDVDTGGWCLLIASFALLLALTQLDERTVWEALPRAAGGREQTTLAQTTLEETGPEPTSGTMQANALLACVACDLIAPDAADGDRCGRCKAVLHKRKPYSIERTTALVVAGYLLYIPANLLPVLTVVRFGQEDRNTILSGVLELIRNDLWPLAVIVFVASIVLPLMKLFGLTWMLIAVDSGSPGVLVSRTRLYRAIDSIGRWSNIDVFMAAILIALLQFGALTAVYVGPGMLAFASVVVLTMFATGVFDTRLMWDAAGRNAQRPTA